MSREKTPADLVRDHVALGERERRARQTVRVLARVAPVGAGVAAAVAILGRFVVWARWGALAWLAALAVAALIFLVIRRRAIHVSDKMAARMDDEAGLAGELRSAHWFAAQDSTSPWSHYHLEKAGARLDGVSWGSVYPPVRAPRQWGVTALLTVTALLLTLRMPAARAVTTTLDPELAAAAGAPIEELPPELAKRLDELLADAKAGTLSPADAKQLADLKKLLDKMGVTADSKLADLAKQLKDAMKQDGANGDLSNAADQSAEELKQAMDDLASKLAKGEKQSDQPDPNAATAANADASQFGKGAQAKAQQGTAGEAKMQVVREQSGDPANAQAMMGGGAMSGDKSTGRGGNNNGRGKDPAALLKAEALKKELIEAQADALGQNVQKEDLRRKTEQGKSGLAYTRAAAATTVDRSRAVPPPPVPDARRALVQSYFIRPIIR